MVEKRYYLIPLFLATLLMALHFLANRYFLYWSLWWYDTAMHFLGGMVIGAVSNWFIYRTRFLNYSKFTVIVFSIAVAFTVAVGWEFFEYNAGITYHHFASYTFDTVKDIVTAVLAAALFATVCITPRSFITQHAEY